MPAKGTISKPLTSSQLNKRTVSAVEAAKSKRKTKKTAARSTPKRISAFKQFRESAINHAALVNAAEIKMKLATNEKGEWRPTKLVKNFNAENPSLAKLKKFLVSEGALKILKKHPVDGKYVCVDYATKLHNLAQKSGIRCGLVDILYTHGYGHTMVAFATTDHGTVFVDFAMLANYDMSGFLGGKTKDEDAFFKTVVQPHYATSSGNHRHNIAHVTITW